MGSPTDIDDEIDKQTLEEMTRFTTSTDIKNILVTGGNGFLYAPRTSMSESPSLIPTDHLLLPLCVGGTEN